MGKVPGSDLARKLIINNSQNFELTRDDSKVGKEDEARKERKKTAENDAISPSNVGFRHAVLKMCANNFCQSWASETVGNFIWTLGLETFKAPVIRV